MDGGMGMGMGIGMQEGLGSVVRMLGEGWRVGKMG